MCPLSTHDAALVPDPDDAPLTPPPPPSPWRGFAAAGEGFVPTAELRPLFQRALAYVRAGVPLHLTGAPGLGKTTFAMALARRLGRPVTVMTGHHAMTGADLLGREIGQTTQEVVDKFVQRVRRSEARSRIDWQDSLLAVAMAEGHVLVFDDFARAPAGVTGLLLPVLEEGMLITTDPAARRVIQSAHPAFRIILTSNPAGDTGVAPVAAAVRDRLVTLTLPAPGADSAAQIVAARSGLGAGPSARLVAVLARLAPPDGAAPSLRPALLIARILAAHPAWVLDDAALARVICDVVAQAFPGVTEASVGEALAALPARDSTEVAA